MRTDNPFHKKAAQGHGRKGREGKAWSVDEEQRLYDCFSEHADVRNLSIQHARTEGGIKSRLKILGLLDEVEQIVRPKPPFHPSRMSLARIIHRKHSPTEAELKAWSEASFLDMFRQLPIQQRSILLEVMRGLITLI